MSRMTYLTILGILFVELPLTADDETASEVVTSQATEAAEQPAEATTDEESPTAEESDSEDSAESQGDGKVTDNAEEPEDSVSDEEFLQDPFGYLQSDMQSATLDLKDGETKPPATVTQPRILSRLDVLIKQLEEQSGGAGQAGQRVNRPAQQSSLMRGPGGQNEMRAPRDDGRDWANLTPKERQKILQSRTDGFPAGYDEILADYFRRVARAEEPASTSPDDRVDESIEPDAGSN